MHLAEIIVKWINNLTIENLNRDRLARLAYVLTSDQASKSIQWEELAFGGRTGTADETRTKIPGSEERPPSVG